MPQRIHQPEIAVSPTAVVSQEDIEQPATVVQPPDIVPPAGEEYFVNTVPAPMLLELWAGQYPRTLGVPLYHVKKQCHISMVI